MSLKRKQKPKKKKKINVTKRQNGVSYVCSNCGIEEKIPVGVLEELDELYPEQLLLGGHQFKCEKCDIGIMKEKESRSIIRGYGLFEGIKKGSL
jgi:predicted RNA-binding Zn-ribbon protein involved in translation (DUF1610 family)